jgi:hypothetical protein
MMPTGVIFRSASTATTGKGPPQVWPALGQHLLITNKSRVASVICPVYRELRIHTPADLATRVHCTAYTGTSEPAGMKILTAYA